MAMCLLENTSSDKLRPYWKNWRSLLHFSSSSCLYKKNAFLEVWTLHKTCENWWTCQKWWNILYAMGQLNFCHTMVLQKEDLFFGLNSHILCRTFRTLIFTRSLNCDECLDIDHTPSFFWGFFFFFFFFYKYLKCQKPTFSNFTDLLENLHIASLDCPWKNSVQRNWWFNMTPKSRINHFLTKIAQTGSVAYLRIDMSDYNETWVSTSIHSL